PEGTLYPPGPAEVVALPWLPPAADDADRQRDALLAVGARFGVERARCLLVDTYLDVRRGRWRHGPPPAVTEVPFPVEGYPEIHDEYDWYDFGIGLKLAGTARPGEAQLLGAFHDFWLEPYFDPDAIAAAAAGEDAYPDTESEDDEDDEDDEGDDEFAALMPYRQADVEYDPGRRTVVLWVDRFQPAPVEDLGHHLLWIASRIHDVLPLRHARF